IVGGVVRRDHDREWPGEAEQLHRLSGAPDSRNARGGGVYRAEHRRPGRHRGAVSPADGSRGVQRDLCSDGETDPAVTDWEGDVRGSHSEEWAQEVTAPQAP